MQGAGLEGLWEVFPLLNSLIEAQLQNRPADLRGHGRRQLGREQRQLLNFNLGWTWAHPFGGEGWGACHEAASACEQLFSLWLWSPGGVTGGWQDVGDLRFPPSNPSCHFCIVPDRWCNNSSRSALLEISICLFCFRKRKGSVVFDHQKILFFLNQETLLLYVLIFFSAWVYNVSWWRFGQEKHKRKPRQFLFLKAISF